MPVVFNDASCYTCKLLSNTYLVRFYFDRYPGPKPQLGVYLEAVHKPCNEVLGFILRQKERNINM